MALSDRDRDFLACVAGGESINDYARRNNYTLSWGVYASRKIRDHFGVNTIREAVAMADDDAGVSRADFDKLFGAFTKLSDAVEDLAKRPADSGAQQQVKERELDVKDHAKALGLSLEDVEKLKGEKEYERFKTMQDRLDAERAAEDDMIDEDTNGGGDRNLGDVIKDGLGGITNRAKTQ